MILYHYYDKKTGPYKNLSDLSEEEANSILQRKNPVCRSKLRSRKKGV